jgi:hypothetical protein
MILERRTTMAKTTKPKIVRQEPAASQGDFAAVAVIVRGQPGVEIGIEIAGFKIRGIMPASNALAVGAELLAAGKEAMGLPLSRGILKQHPAK